ncbi:leucine-rich repeat domain-containing protein [uncultured Aquimarina sp.]|uniref:leucine-rich repeat domain-containing protein n=1 Tax=uncultured Aquimarina sp. TaxID=575652 RepID=UPI0026374B70|nr:leucine-rich repeat domain-containing protein [uncultured Aquimarina sp.]
MKNLNQYIIKNGILLLLCLCSSIVSIAQVSPQERQALIDLYHATDGDNWTNTLAGNRPWLVNDSSSLISSWGGVTVLDGKVTKISLINNNLNGTIPESFGDLVNLDYVAFSINRLTGSLPATIGNLINVETFTLERNAITGEIPISIGTMVSLKILNLGSNQMTGGIPSELGNLLLLKQLNLFRNRLSGSIPSEINSLIDLTHLNLFSNTLTGSIPDLSSLSKLIFFNLYRNQLEGEIPSYLGALPELIAIGLSINRLTGSIPPLLGNLSKLTTLTLDSNALTGEIPRELGQLTALTTLHLYRNQLTGSIPVEIGDLPSLSSLRISSNNLSGKVPSRLLSIVNSNILNTLGFAQNNFVFSDFELQFQAYKDNLTTFAYLSQGQVDQIETRSVLTGQSITLTSNALTSNNNRYQWFKNNVVIPGATDKDLVISNASDSDAGVYHFTATNTIINELSLRRNPITLEIGCRVSEAEKQALIDLYNSTNGPNWTSDNNWLTDTPVCDWTGVTVVDGKVTGLYLFGGGVMGSLPNSIGNLVYLTSLTITRSYGLSGVIPSTIGNLINLQSLDLAGNVLTGDVPSSLGNLTSLTYLNLAINKLDGTIPQELGNLVGLTQLGLTRNALTGSIPGSLSNLTKLTSLNLSINQLTGNIPAELGTMTNLTSLTLQRNVLSGMIPLELGTMTNLTNLNLFQNQLTGSIPPELGNLQNLVSLNLGRNVLIGPIPVALGNLTNLESLDLGSNGLTSIAPELGNLTKLKSLILYINQITSPIPAEIGNLTSLETFTVERNAITGAIPAELGNLTKLKSLSLNSNRLTGSIPNELGQLSELTLLNLYRNQLSGNVPNELGNLSKLQTLGLSTNQLSGSIPASLRSLITSDVLNVFTIDQNNFIFNDFETDFSLYQSDLTTFNYLIQGKVDQTETLSVEENGTITLTSNVLTSVNNRYQWYKNNVVISGATDKDLVITDATEGDAGVYYFTATNSVVTDLTLERNPITLTITPVVDTCGVSESEKQALIDLYNSTDGANWINNTNWLTDAPVCDWFGVTVVDGKVVTLYLLNNNLVGSFTSSIENLVNIKRLTISRNTGLVGNIPVSISNLSSLELIELSSNSLTGEIPSQLGNINNLHTLSVFGNELTGFIPAELGNLQNLVKLSIGRNSLTGNIPASIGNLENLESLEFNSNQLTGPIPIEFGNLLKLVRLDLTRNQLSGSIPSLIGNLQNLEYLLLTSNELNGSIPSTIGNLVKLKNLTLGSNNFIGQIPPSLSNLSNLSVLHLFRNQFTGSIDNAIGNLPNLSQFNVESNLLSGIVPSGFSTLTSSGIMTKLELTRNSFIFENFESEFQVYLNDLSFFSYQIQNKVDETETLSVPENGTITLTSNVLTSVNNSYQWYKNNVIISGATNKNLVITDASDTDAGVYHFTATNSIVIDLTLTRNPITLTVTEQICGVSEAEKQALLDFYNSTDGTNWINTQANNQPWDENIPVCDWYGVTVTDNKVTGLNLENNQLQGIIPTSIRDLIHLTSLDLNTNTLTGEIPSSLGTLLELTYLSLANNNLGGILSPTLGSLSSLVTMDISNNQLVGVIPVAFCNLSNLETLNLSNNQLSEGIPIQLGILTKLRNLILNANQFTGIIPSQLTALSNLESVKVENNQLSGSIPFTISEFSKLDEFTFENNKFIFSNFENKHGNYSMYLNTGYSYSPQDKTDKVENKTVTAGNSITLSTVLSSENNNYQWYKGNTLIQGATANTLVIENAILEDAGEYYFRATNNIVTGLQLERNVITLTVKESCEVAATERQALIDIYNATAGANWNNTQTANQPWSINDASVSICDWYGVMIDKNRVIEIDLSANNLVGNLPDVFNNLPYLKKIQLHSNSLQGNLPVSLSSIAGLEIFSIENNRYIFSDIESGYSNYKLKLGDNFTYLPQANVDDSNTYVVDETGTITLTSNQLVSNNNQYQWFKNGLPIEGATAKEYTITNATSADQAGYFFEATNTTVENLVLIRNMIMVEIRPQGDECFVSSSEKQALIDLYNSTNGSNWTNNTNWLTDAPVCDWYGVTVIEGKVTELYLYNNKLSGVLPSTINQLSNLTRLTLAVNRLSGNIPEELGELKELYYLHLGMNLFSGEIPVKLYQLQNLTDITLANNELSGLVSSQIGNLINLTRIDFGGNLLSGNIPSEIESLANLRHIELNDNQFTGNIPIELGGLSNLQVLLLYNNKLEGPIPNELGLLTELNRLNLSANLLTGEVPIEINNLNKLEDFSFAFNKISGKIPLDLNALRKLIFSNNQFVFSDIEEKFDLFRSELVNNYRYFPQAKVDEIETKSIVSGQSVTLTSTALTSTNNSYQWFKTVNGSTIEIPGATDREYTIENVADTDAGIYHFTATNSIVTDLTLTRNPITLEVLAAGACAVSDEDRQALIDFYQTTNGDGWTNTTEGNQPWLINDPTSKVCDWFGVTVSFDYKVESIQLPGNNLRGEIPISLEILKDLKVLDLSQNNMIGEIPAALGNMPNLQSLNLRENVLVGVIPDAITNVTNLQILDLGLNRFSSVIPTNIGGLQALTYLDLSENKLEGTIPESLYTSLSLEVIKLQKNILNGGVSSSIGDLVNLEVFWLSENNFSGAIPPSITSIPGLYSVHLDANAFESDLPLLIPNFALANTEVQINNNRFVFSDFEDEHPQYRGNLTNYTYIPQAKVDRVETIIVEIGGSSRLFTDDLTSPNNTYRWFKGQDFFVETQLREITIDNITEADLGDYYFVATNSTIENLELTRNRITLRLEDVNPPGDDCNVLEGVADGSFESLFNVASTNSQSNSDVTSSGGWQVFSQTPDSWRTPITGNRAFISQRHPKSPDGEVFVGALGRYDLSGNGEGAIEIEGITTTINNLDIGQEYRITFYQSNGTNKILHDNITPDPDDAGNWKIVFGSETKYSDLILVEDNGVWQEQSLVFTASSQQQDLSFIASAITKPANSYVHIYMLVDDIKVTKVGGNCGDTTSDYEFCLSQDSPTIADLTSPITGTDVVTWYESETDGEPLPLDFEITENFTYWADDNSGNQRVSVDVNVYGSFTIDDDSENYDYQSFAISTDPRISNLQSPGENIRWYSAAVGGIEYNDSDPLIDGNSYYAQQGDSSCRFEVSVFVGVFPPIGDGWQYFCKSVDPRLDSIELADLDPGHNYRWYSQEIGGTILDTTMGLLDGDVYFVSVIDPQGNESERRRIEVSVYDVPSPYVTRTHQVFYSNDPVTVSELVAIGNNVIWYDENGIAFDPDTYLDENVTYYAAQTDLNCKEGDLNCCVSTDRIAVTVQILAEEPPGLIGCERFRPQPGEHYVISGWVREDGLLAVDPIVENFSAVSAVFVKLLNHLYNDILIADTSIPPVYKTTDREFDKLIPFVTDAVDKNLTIYNFKPYKEKQNGKGPDRTVGFQFSLIPGDNAPVYRYKTPRVRLIGASSSLGYNYPLVHNSEVMNLKFVDVTISGSTLNIVSDFNIVGSPYSYTENDATIGVSNAGIKNEITTYTYISDPDYQVMRYANSRMKLIFKSGEPTATNDELTEIQNIMFEPSGAIIDGWQRISADFTIPFEAINMTISLENKIQANAPEINVYFDDIRVHPFEGNMKTFVYDPITQRLQAELDENNYATFYEYDQEGGLIRVKKETERGVFTIQETRSGNAKRTN